MNNSEILIYQNSEGNIKIDVRLEEESVWLNQSQMAELFGKGRTTITEHIQNVFSEGELEENVVCRNFRHTTQHGAIEGKTQETTTKYYNLDVIISVGYRVKSPQGTQFRIWATQRLKEYIIKGFTLNDDRFKSGSSMNYFNELQERIREIRLSEQIIQSAMFTEDYRQMVIVKDIDFYSMCEHHMLPFFGKAHVAYIPNKKITGLSKIARVVVEPVHRRPTAAFDVVQK
jgi:hypothetical protein